MNFLQSEKFHSTEMVACNVSKFLYGKLKVTN